ncbi:intercompartmental signaling factor BofC [Alkalihalobacterium chitinilyticum]|uniref:Intercompartmental signaling factor BofC n=1 Tax=Alkalihalobacterium chitinilyticum TaxID=2980103 RepID=A0ABT5VHS7_9BACI|nr:intercompartmental signaling factor BofC [Alkalihalobacterium chitinilyticum]MDE5415015.1 intercompartmental signaling factor BofC [Alkalihalobacterium chitinilyticum]
MKDGQIIKKITKKHMVIAVLFSLCFVLLLGFQPEGANTIQSHASKSVVPVMKMVENADAGPKTIQVKLQRVYLDGEISEEVVEETIWSMEDFWAFYDQWLLVDQNEEEILFKQEIDDISPLLKINGYFGISEDGVLNIYEGKPDDQKIIQSFFQINTQKLKSHHESELKNGIPVMSRENYQEVLKTLEKYAITEM